MNLMDHFTALRAKAEQELLPGWEELFHSNDKIKPYIEDCEDRCKRAVEDEDEILLERALKDYVRAWRRVNERLAEKYMEENPDPTRWELRYMKWMKPGYLKFDSRVGPFYITLGKPNRRAPSDAPCFTVDEALVLLDPIVSKVVNTFDALPIKAGQVAPPDPGDVIDHVFVDEEGVRIRSEIGRKKSYRGR